MEKGGFILRYIQYETGTLVYLNLDFAVVQSGVLANGNMSRIFRFEVKPTQGPLPTWLTTKEFDISVEYTKRDRIVNFADIPNVGNPDTAFLIASCYYQTASLVEWDGN